MSVWFVTPAFQRYELTAVCLEQRQLVIEDLARRGIEAHCVVIADDENLDTARALSMDTIEQNNEWLGRRFNDGIQHAALHGAKWIVPIGSDSFVDPAYLFPLPVGVMRTSTLYAIAEPHRLGRLEVQGNGVGPYMIPRPYLPNTLRPAKDERNSGIDRSTLGGLRSGLVHETRDLHPWQYIGFRSRPQLNPYADLYGAFGVGEDYEVGESLSQHYPLSLVQRALAACVVAEGVA
jgi:hypothetical protein